MEGGDGGRKIERRGINLMPSEDFYNNHVAEVSFRTSISSKIKKKKKKKSF